jgi:prepilin-type N-terminal cleavage/methylation domain-containing protein
MLALKQKGFTLIELVIAIAVSGILSSILFVFFGNSLAQYVTLQEDGSAFTDVSLNSQRIAAVLRGGTNITSATNSSITLYSYFAPNDQYVSIIKYYPDATSKRLLADVTRMTANPPIGTPINGSLKTVTIIDDFYVPTGTNTFEYLDSAGGTLGMPIADYTTIKGVRINLVTKASKRNSVPTTLSVEVGLRNKKTNL